MTQNRLAKTILLPFLVILSGFFLYACERPGGSAGDTERLNKIAEQVKMLTEKVDKLGQRLDALSKQAAAPVSGGSLLVCQPAEPPGPP